MSKKSTRKSSVSRKTKETDIQISLELDGQGNNNIDTGVPFLDHMLTLFSVHGLFNISIKAHGDIEIDDHHSVEDIGISLGQAFNKALGDHSGINRYGNSAVPMDEALVRVDLDVSNRPFLHYDVAIKEHKVGKFDTELAKEFFRAFSLHGGITLHIEKVRGDNGHHIIESAFKAVGRALNQATTLNSSIKGILSSKGSL